jgi:hypothetical protein
LKHLATIFLTFIFLGTSWAENPEWSEGSLVLKTNEVLTGTLSIQPKYDLVLFQDKHSNQVVAFPAHKLYSAYFFDKILGVNRKFTSIQQNNGLGKSFKLYEVVLFGEVNIIRRIKSIYTEEHNHILSYNYYIEQNDKLVILRKFKSKVLPHLSETSPSIVSYIREQKLNPNRPACVVKIIKFYNKQFHLSPIAKSE